MLIRLRGSSLPLAILPRRSLRNFGNPRTLGEMLPIMDKEKVFTKNGQILFRDTKAFNLQIDTKYIHPDYKLHNYPEESNLSKTGLLKLFTIKTKVKSNKPLFSVRWDEKNNEVDIDILNVEKNINTLFKAEKSGCLGHHTQRTSESPRIFYILIKTPNQTIYEGNITFNINKGNPVFDNLIK